jgi:hypothetical protein
MSYLRRLFLALDILANVLLVGRVETLSSRMGRAIREGRRCLLCRLICSVLNWRWKDHCVNNIIDPLDKG